MTPLAHKIVKQLTLPIKDRSINDLSNMLPRMSDVHCFECSEITDLALDMGHQMVQDYRNGSWPTETRFLPAPKTWIEYHDEDNRMRIGFLLENQGYGPKAKVSSAVSRNGNLLSSPRIGAIPLTKELFGSESTTALDLWDHLDGGEVQVGTEIGDFWYSSLIFLYGALILINSPKVIGRKVTQHHKGLQKKLLENREITGSFPLRAWTEITLKVPCPKNAHGSIDGHYTGKRALHFVRTFGRVRLGKVEIVKAHWRGDASIGIKRSRYKLKMAG